MIYDRSHRVAKTEGISRNHQIQYGMANRRSTMSPRQKHNRAANWRRVYPHALQAARHRETRSRQCLMVCMATDVCRAMTTTVDLAAWSSIQGHAYAPSPPLPSTAGYCTTLQYCCRLASGLWACYSSSASLSPPATFRPLLVLGVHRLADYSGIQGLISRDIDDWRVPERSSLVEWRLSCMPTPAASPLCISKLSPTSKFMDLSIGRAPKLLQLRTAETCRSETDSTPSSVSLSVLLREDNDSHAPSALHSCSSCLAKFVAYRIRVF